VTANGWVIRFAVDDLDSSMKLIDLWEDEFERLNGSDRLLHHVVSESAGV
jgi:hypothetical protein